MWAPRIWSYKTKKELGLPDFCGCLSLQSPPPLPISTNALHLYGYTFYSMDTLDMI